MGNVRGSNKISEEDYEFHLKENFPETHSDHTNPSHPSDI